MDKSSSHSGYNRSNSNNVEFIPLKQGDFSGDDGQTSGGHLRNRSANSPLPAVPLPEKKSRVANRTHASCDDITKLSPARNSSISQQQPTRLVRASSMDFDMFNRSTSINQPLLGNESSIETNSQSRNATLRMGNSTAKYTPIHDYEELNEHDRRIQVQIAQGLHPSNGNNSQANFQPMAVHGTSTPVSAPAPLLSQSGLESNRQYPRERQNPMYSGVQPLSPFQNLNEQPTVKTEPPAISENCACAMLGFLIAAIIISLTSVIIVALFATGIVTPVNSSDEVIQSQMRDLKNELNMVKIKLQAQVEEAQQKRVMYVNMMNDLQNQIDQVAMNKSAVRISEIQSQLTDAIQSLTPNEIESIFGSLSGSALSRCKYEEGSIGSSSHLDKTDSGEYYAEDGYVITGATCSSSVSSHVGTLQTREESVGEKIRVLYKCDCLKIANLKATSSGSFTCKIDYWQCPVSPA